MKSDRTVCKLRVNRTGVRTRGSLPGVKGRVLTAEILRHLSCLESFSHLLNHSTNIYEEPANRQPFPGPGLAAAGSAGSAPCAGLAHWRLAVVCKVKLLSKMFQVDSAAVCAFCGSETYIQFRSVLGHTHRPQTVSQIPLNPPQFPPASGAKHTAGSGGAQPFTENRILTLIVVCGRGVGR